MAEGYTTVELQSPFSISTEVVNAKKTIKASSVADVNYWRSTHAQKYIEANAKVVQKGVDFTRIFIHSREILQQNIDILENQDKLGIRVYVVYLEELPSDLNEDYIIIDDRIFARLELTGHGQAREERISVEPVEVDRMIRKFDALFRYSRSFEQVKDELKS